MSSAGPIFDAYVMVDWSAARKPVRGANGIWYACFERTDAGLVERVVSNPPTRTEAVEQLADLLSDLAARGLATLLGFDFAFGFPKGFAARMGGNWRAVWRRLASEMRDDSKNANNRFQVASKLNEEFSGRGFPFWGCDGADATATLSPTRSEGYGEASFLEFRIAEQCARSAGARPHSPWKLWTSGSVGGQTLTGIPRAEHLRRHPWLADLTRVWPFETGLKSLTRSPDWRILMAEIYPSLVAVRPAEGEVKDRAQVIALARHFAALDDAGTLADQFAGDPTLSAEERRIVEHEEGWILGVTTDDRVDIHAWIKDPAEIYRQSFATIRAEIGLEAVPPDLRDVVVRVVHACGMTEIAADLAWSEAAGDAGRAALAAGAPILVDAEMVAHGIIKRRLPKDNRVLCMLNDPEVAGEAARIGTTRSAMAVDKWAPLLDGAVIAIGNAPTALFRLLELMQQGAPRPALVLGFPVGFVGAVESKEALRQSGLPFITLRGRKGGSAMAAAAVNALAGGLA
jgi:precorrin-8X/cobalt-precorrin-8 methylmutase